MYRIVLPAALAAVVASASLAFAAQTTGTIKTYDANAMTITLSDGTQYYLPKDFKNPGLMPGKNVQITWSMQGNKHEASEVVMQ